jgi:hypothetical protein
MVSIILPNGKMVGPGRLELPTSRLSGVRSNHLSYGPFSGTRQRTIPLMVAFPHRTTDVMVGKTPGSQVRLGER